MKYIYYDGAGNKYQIDGLRLSYFPIKREHSSSGNYDGGDAFIKDLEKADLVKVVSVLETAIWDKADHTEKREMGTGMIVKSLINAEPIKVILKMKSDYHSNIIQLLKSF